jgi:DNA-directed RNA polymerase specialized sigma24 family protein
MFSARRSATEASERYAIAADFCRIFENNLNRLYLLSYLLTADRALAEECFVRGMEDSTRSNRVFREWAESWARRTIIHNAIQMVRPRPSDLGAHSSPTPSGSSEPKQISAVVALPAFERFVFVMTVLERQSYQECSLLLGCRRADVMAARNRALQRIGQTGERSGQQELVSSSEAACQAEASATASITALSRLAITA